MLPVIFETFRSAHVTPMLHSLHWLPIEQRIENKLSLFPLRLSPIKPPSTFQTFVVVFVVVVVLLLHSFSAAPLFCSHPIVQNTILSHKSSGQRYFSYQAPTTWNQLPVSVRTSVSSFKSSSKILLCSKKLSSDDYPELRERVCVRAYVCVCVCVRTCVRACMRACVRECVRARACVRA